MAKERCAHCKKLLDKPTGEINRAKAAGLKLFCNRVCFGLSRRVDKTDKQKKADKKAYDAEYRLKNKRRIKKRKKEYFKKDYEANPEKYKKQRQGQRENHSEYCRQPEYKKYKKKYDQKHRATKNFGDYAEAFIILQKIESIVDNKLARQDKNCHNKSQKRRKLWKSSQQ